MNREHGAEIFLDKDARKWANQLTKDQMSIAALRKQVKGLQSVTSAYTKVRTILIYTFLKKLRTQIFFKTPEFGTSDAQAEALQKTDLLLEEIRQLEVQTTKAEARLDALREAGIDVNKWMQKAEKSYGGEKASVSSSNELTPNTSYSSMGKTGVFARKPEILNLLVILLGPYQPVFQSLFLQNGFTVDMRVVLTCPLLGVCPLLECPSTV